MNKNNLYKIFMLPVLIFVLTGCDKFLDIEPSGSTIITTAEDFRKMLSHAYSVVPQDRGLATFRADEYIMDASISKEDLNSYKDIWLWNDNAPDDGTASFNWRRYYQVIYEANYTIESKDKIKNGSESEINQLVGESYMLRAYMHFLLTNLFGEPYTSVSNPENVKAVPLKLNTSSEEVLKRSSLKDIYQQIEADINEAERLMNVETWPAGYNYRFNKISVDAFRSRFYLYAGDWSNSLQASENVLKIKNELSDLSKEFPNNYNSVENIVALEQVMSSYYFRAGKVNTTLWRKYNSNDLRRSKYFKQVTTSNIQLLKGGSNDFSCTFRVGEIYLNAAEASLRLSDSNIEISRDYLLSLMETRYKPDYYLTKEAEIRAMNSEELLAEILLEREKELAFEGHRWFDLRRTTRQEIIKSFKDETFTLEENDVRYTLRIPSEAIESNPELAN